MPQLPISLPPGVCLSASGYAAGKDAGYVGAGSGSFRQGSGRWIQATNIEFIAGYGQKIAGWAQATTTLTTGVPRAVCVWRDDTGHPRTGIGTETHLYYLLGSTLVDITPLRTIVSGALTDVVSTTNASRLVAIADSAQTLVNGDFVFLSASAVGGITLNGWYPVSSRTGSGYNITFPTAATSMAGPGGGTLTYQYPRTTLTNPFTTTNASATVVVHHVASGALAGAYVTFSGASAVAGLTLNGEYRIVSIIDADNYRITTSGPANASTSGGGAVSVIYDIVVQQATSATSGAYGRGSYGTGAYGRGSAALPILANGWTLAAYGNQLLAAPIGGTIYIYNPVFGGRAYPMLNAPIALNAMFVTPERFVVALGLGGNLMSLAWCDQSDYTVWTTTVTNTANTGRTLVGGSQLIGGIGIRNGVSLIFSDKSAFEMNYTGGQEIYSTSQIGDNCGLVSPIAVCAEGGVAYWFSDQDFWSWNGGVSPLPTDDIRAYVFQAGDGQSNMNRNYINKCAVQLNRAKRQVRFWWPNQGNSENSVGVIFQYDQPCWSQMDFGRTAGQDANLLPSPVSTDAAGYIYFDEIGVDANSTTLGCTLVSSDIDISNGDRNMDIFTFIPDFQTIRGDVLLIAVSSFYPDDLDDRTLTNYIIEEDTARIDMRENGKIFSFVLNSADIGFTIRMGIPRLEIQPAGARR